MSELDAPFEGGPRSRAFDPDSLDRSVISLPLLKEMAEAEGQEHRVMIDLNLDYHAGRDAARERVGDLLEGLPGADPISKTPRLSQYVTATIPTEQIYELVRRDRVVGVAETERPSERRLYQAIFRIWPDFPVRGLLTKSLSTVKADAALSAFDAAGDRVVWAVVDSGVIRHPHFDYHGNLDLKGLEPLKHLDFTGEEDACRDDFGHGTHVAGIIAGEIPRAPERPDGLPSPHSAVRARDERGAVRYYLEEEAAVSGVAPRCTIVSLKVLDARGESFASRVIQALEWIQEVNGHGRRLRIHGVNLSVGYGFDPVWFACGQSPLCVEVDRLVRSGVVVVAAAGNTGYGRVDSRDRGPVSAGLSLTINDPGNAEHAITVGSTHREMPHTYGVSYFSSKGPTGDGRMKPDLLAPGEKVLSCAAGDPRSLAEGAMAFEGCRAPVTPALYLEQSGTSMAAPHVSGAAAAFLSIRREFIGRPEDVKRIFKATATDLNRDPYFQGAGLLDLMRAIQSV